MPAKAAMPILVVDDFPTMVRVVCGLLSQIGFDNVDHTHDGDLALSLIRRRSYDLIICDWMMLPVSGLDILRAARQSPKRDSTRFLMMSADSRTDGLMAARKAGVDGCILKPFRGVDLRAKIDQLFAPPPGMPSAVISWLQGRNDGRRPQVVAGE